MDKKLPICATIKDGFKIGLVNFLSLIATAILYLLTIWIPYLNVGTTIAMSSLPAELAKGHVIKPTFIFEGRFRRNMGEFFILMTLMSGAIGIGFMFGIIPGFVIAIAWSFAAVLFVDKDLNAIDCLRESNRLTYGNKARLFWAEFLVGLCLGIIISIIGALFSIGEIRALEIIGLIINCVIILFIVPALYGVEASIYRQLTTGKFLGEEEKIEAPAAAVEPAAPKAPKAEKPAAKKPAAKKPAAKKPAAKK